MPHAALLLLSDAVMARVLALLLAVTIAAPSFADESFDAERHARRMRKSGAGLMSVGVIHLGGGLALTLAMIGMSVSCRNDPFPCNDEGSGFLMFPAIGLLAVGGLLTAVGMPLFFVGRNRERRQRQLALIPTPMGQLTPVPPMPQ
jgi:hypothetical protein